MQAPRRRKAARSGRKACADTLPYYQTCLYILKVQGIVKLGYQALILPFALSFAYYNTPAIKLLETQKTKGSTYKGIAKIQVLA